MVQTLTGRLRSARSAALRPAAVRRRIADGPETIYLVAPTGYPNSGDEYIARAWLRYLARTRPWARVVLDCHTPGTAALELRGDHPRVIFVDTLWRLTEHAVSGADEAIDAERPWEWVAEAASQFGVAPHRAEGVDLLLRADTLHLLGGGYLNEVWPHHVALVAALAAVSRRTGAPAFATGQGLVPKVTGDAWKALILAGRDFAVFDVRDAPSRDLIAELPGARFTGDDLWLVGRPARRRRSAGDPGVILCIQSDLTDDFVGPTGDTGVTALTDWVADTLDAWKIPGCAVTVVEGMPGEDMTVPLLLGDRLAGSTVLPFLQVWRDGLPVGSGATWISTRFHPHLVAAAAGDSGVAVVPKPDYYATKHQSLLDAGSRWTLVADGRSVPDRPTAGGFPREAVTAARSAKRRLAGELYPLPLRRG